MHELYQQIITEVRSAWRFRWLALAAAWVVCLGGWAWSVTQPDVYEASARVYVDTSSELRNLLGNQIVDPDVNAQLNFVRQAMLGRTQMERVARSTGLDRDAASDVELQRVIDTLRNRIRINASSGGGRNAQPNLFSISYQHRDRNVAINVVDTLLNSFVEDTLGVRRASSESARRFLEQQVREYEARLQEAESRLAQFRRENFDRLPGTEGGYFARLQAETEALTQAEKDLELAQSRRARIEQRLRGEASEGQAPLLPGEGEGSLTARIREHETRLEELLLRYTDRHPDVVATRETLEQLESRRAQELELLTAGGGAGSSDNPVSQALEISLNEVEIDIAALEANVADRRQRVERLRSLIDEVPEVEAQLARLDRDYGVVQSQHRSLVESLERERLSREAQQTDQVEFRVIDPPVADFNPVAPNRPMLVAMVLLFGLGSGGGAAFVLGQLRPVFQTPRDLHEQIGLPVLGAVSLTWKTRHTVRRRLAVTGFLAAGLALVAVFAVIYLAESRGHSVLGLMERIL